MRYVYIMSRSHPWSYMFQGLSINSTTSQEKKNWLRHCCSCTLQPPLFITPLIGKLQPDCFNWIRWKHDSTSSALRKQVCHTDIYLNKPAGNQHQLNNSSQIFILWCSEGIEILTPNIVKVNNLQTALSNEPVSEQLFTTSQILILLALQEVPQLVCTLKCFCPAANITSFLPDLTSHWNPICQLKQKEKVSSSLRSILRLQSGSEKEVSSTTLLY